ncbi:MAG: T9SS type A sorting domain-containing protein [Bacteroidia bacterium]|nr:T9SS type A sorting domain-containing protein [Bacteroidia bacterium]
MRTSSGSGNWTAGTTWVGGIAPGSLDTAIIASGHTVTLNANSSITSITINTGGILDVGIFSFNSGVRVTNNGVLRTANPSGLLATGGSFPGATIAFGTSSTTVFNGATTQTVDALPYRNLTISNNAATKVASTSGTTSVLGNFTIDAGVTYDKNNADLWLYRGVSGTGLMASTGGYLRFEGNATTTLGTLTMAPAPNNVIGFLEMNANASGANLTLGSPMQISTRFLHWWGRIVTTSTNILQLGNAAVERRWWNESMPTANAYVDGPVSLTSTTTGWKQLNIGKNGIASVVWINPSSAATTTYIVEYFNGAGVVPNSANLDAATLNGVYTNQYWSINRVSGSANPQIQLAYYQVPTGGTAAQTITIANYNGTQWSSLPIDRSIRADTSNTFLQIPTFVTTNGLYCLANLRSIATAQSGNWNNPTTWVGGVVPGATQSAQIVSGHTVTVTANAPIMRVEVQAGATLSLTTNQLTGMTAGLQNRGTVQTANNSGLIGGSIPAANSTNTTMFSGSRVVYNGGASQTVSAFTYDDLVISNSASTKTLNGSAIVNDTLLINSLCVFNKLNHNLTINRVLAGTGNLNSTGGVITLNGTGVQSTLNAGTSFTNTGLIINMNNGTNDALVLGAPVTFSTISLNTGIIKTDSINVLTLSTSAIGSSTAYINGPVQLLTSSTNSIGVTLGKSGLISNFIVSPSSATATTWTVEFLNSAVPDNTNLGAGLVGLGANQYWTIMRSNSNTAVVGVTLAQSAGGLATQSLRLALYGSQWSPILLTSNNIPANIAAASLTTASTVPLTTVGVKELLAVGISSQGAPVTLVSAGSGNWSNAATWSPAQVPQPGDRVTILNGHVVTLDVPILPGGGPASLIVNSGGELSIPDGISFNNSVINSAVLDNILSPVDAAFGLRLLRARYTGPAIRVRVGSTEQDIFFDANGNLDTVQLKSFAGTNSAFVVTWYDQSGNGRNFVQTTQARQPRIVNAGVIDTKTGTPAIRHLAASQHFLTLSPFTLSSSAPWTMNVVQSLDGGANSRMLNSTNNWLIGCWGGNEQAAHFLGWPNPNPLVPATTNNQIYTAISYTSNAHVFRNGNVFTTVALPNAPGTLNTSGYFGNEFSNGTTQEIIAYRTALSASERQTIESSQTNYYINGIFPIPSEGITVNGTLRILSSGGLDSAIVGRLPSFGSNATLVYGGANQNITPVNAVNVLIAGSGTKTLRGRLRVSGSFTVQAGVVFAKDTHNLEITGAFTNNGTMTSTGGLFSVGGTGAIDFGFTPPNNILQSLVLNRPGSHTLTQPLVANGVTFNAGIINTSVANTLTIHGVNVTGGGTNSYVNGALLLSSTSALAVTVPVGKNGVHSLVRLQPQTPDATLFTIEYFNGTGVTANTSSLGAGLTGVASNQYWTISRTGVTPANTVYAFTFNSPAGGSASNALSLASYAGAGPWVRNNIVENILANASTGTITAQTSIGDGSFTLGYSSLVVETGLDSLGLTPATTSSLALGLRKLRSAYNGPAIRVRRSSDSLEQDIFFAASGELDTVSLKSFVGSGSGFISLWYDQSGNNRNAGNATLANQPSIMLSGIINRFGGKPSIRYDGAANSTRDFLQVTIPTQTGTANSLFWVQGTTDNNYMPLFHNNNGNDGWMLIAENGNNTNNDIVGGGSAHAASSFWINGTNTGWNSSTVRSTPYQLLHNTRSIVNVLHQQLNWNNALAIGGRRADSWNFAGDIVEVVITNTTLSAPSRVAIEVSMANYYGISTPNNGWVSKSTGGNWNDANTWEQGTVPPTGASVIIATTGSNAVTLTTNESVAALTVNANARIDFGASNTLTVSGNLVNNGTLITSNPSGLTGVTASVNGTVSYGVNSTVIYNAGVAQQVSGATYRNLTLSNRLGLKTTNGAVTINGICTIDSAVVLVQGANAHTLNFVGTLSGLGTIRPNSGGTIQITGTSGGSVGTLNIDAAPNNIVSIFTINRTGANGSVTLGSNLQATTVNLTSGYVFTSASAILLVNNSSTAGGSASSFINGPVQLVNATVGVGRTLHIGKNAFLGTVTITPNTASSVWRIEYFNTAPTPTTPVQTSLGGIVNNQYWSITKVSAAAAVATIGCTFNIPPGGAADQSLVLATYSAANPIWSLVPVLSNALTGISTTGTLTSSSNVSFSGGALSSADFTIGYPTQWQSIVSGNWRSGSTWSVGAPPPAGSVVRIMSGHTVTVDTTIATIGTPARIIINNGGTLAFNSTNTIGTVANGVTVDGTITTAHASGINTSIGGTITYNFNSTLVYNGANQSVPGVTAENLTFSGSGTKTQTGAIVSAGLFSVSAGVTYAKAAQNLTLNGTFSNAGTMTSTGGFITVGGSSGGSAGTLNMSGTVSTFTMSRYGANPSLTLGAPLSVSAISMENGIVYTDATNTLTLTGTIANQGSSSAHINGPLRINQNTTSMLVLPVGKNTVLGTVRLTPTAGLSAWMVEYFANAPADTTADTAVIGRISPAQYWNVQRSSGTSTATLSFNFNISPGGTSIQGLTLARYTGSIWTIQSTATNVFNGTSVGGILSSTPGVNTFGDFAIGFFTQEFISAGSGNWNNPSTWLANAIPTTSSRVTIKTGHVVTLTASAPAQAINIEAGGVFNLQSNQITGSFVNVNISGILRSANTNGIIGIGSSIPNASYALEPGSEIEYNGTALQQLSPLTYQKLNINNPAGVVVTSTSTVTDSLKISAGELQLGTGTLILNGVLPNNPSTIFDGSGTGNLVLSNTIGNYTIRFDQSNPGVSNRIRSLVVNSTGSTFTVDNTLQVTNNVTPTAGTLNAAGNLILVSNAAGTAYTENGAGTITGNVVVERYIPSIARRWRFLSSPVQSTTVEDWRGETHIAGPGTGTTIGTLNSNGFDATAGNVPSIFGYTETLLGSVNTGWTAPLSTGQSLEVGKGYRLFIRGDRSNTIGKLTFSATPPPQDAVTLNVVGVLNQGNITIPVTCTFAGPGSTYADTSDGWNLIGNPYPGPYDWNAFYDANIGRTNITPTIWTYDPQTNAYQFYNALSNTGNIVGGVVASGQAFWVKANNASPALTLRSVNRVSSTNPASSFFKSTEGGACSIKLIKDSLNADEMFIKYMTGSTEQLDDYDVPKLESAVSISAWGTDNRYLSVTCRPLTASNDTIFLNVKGNATGAYSMHFENASDIAIQDYLTLVDTYLNTFTDLKSTPTYSFQINQSDPTTFGKNRFYIIVSTNNPVPVKLLSFVATKAGDQDALLTWSTGSEKNTSHFEIEWSVDGLRFIELSRVKAKGNTEVKQQYQFMHTGISTSNYYRLRMVDFDGKYAYSPIRFVGQLLSTEQLGIKVWPVPSVDKVTVQSQSGVALASYVVYDAFGKEVMSNLLNQSPQCEIDLSQLNTGIYILKVSTITGEFFNERLVKVSK